MIDIAQNLRNVQQRIQRACIAANRDPSTVKLLAASKRTDANGVEQAVEAGHLLFGENRAQSLRDKYNALKFRCPQAQWHFIGHLQKNKVKYIVGRAKMLHSLDSLELATAIASRIKTQRENGTTVANMKVLIQVKLGEEHTKTGIQQSQALELAERIMEIPELELCGLMNIPPQTGTPLQWFTQVADIRSEGIQRGFPLHELSMGMSGDLEQAIQAGSTIVRLGTAIFGSTSQ